MQYCKQGLYPYWMSIELMNSFVVLYGILQTWWMNH
jgi:hypothetical protein